MPRRLTEEAKTRICTLAKIGLSDMQIASRLGMSVKHLRRLGADELATGRGEGDEALASTAMQMATSGLFPGMTKYLCQVRLGWYEVSGLVVKSGDSERVDGERLANVIDERLTKLREASDARSARLVMADSVKTGVANDS